MTRAARLIDRFELTLPHLPDELEGLTVAHLTDPHIQRPRRRYDDVIACMSAERVDLVFLTGDYMSIPGDEPAAAEVLRRLITSLKPRLGTFGVFGNHDTPDLRRRMMAMSDLAVRWLENECACGVAPGLEVLGIDIDMFTAGDSVALATGWGGGCGETTAGWVRPLRLLLSHLPTYLATAADLGVDVMFAGHTHGGQCRLPGGFALRNSTDFPLRLTSGVLRHRDTLCVTSRGLGEILLPFRTFCPAHLPIYTFRRGPLMGEATDGIENVLPW
jgi:predicted MPP superfamily phosphohydrolase